MRYAQMVIGPAGSGKSTYCMTMQRHGEVSNRNIHVVNLDPAADAFDYQALADIRELIQVEDAMEDEELRFGPNGGLVYCLEYLLKEQDWLKQQLVGDIDDDTIGEPDDDYILFDMPGQIELFTHLDMGARLVKLLESWNFHVCTVFMLDSQFIVSGGKFISGAMAALSVMVNLEMPHANVLSKLDLLPSEQKKKLEQFLDPETEFLIGDVVTNSTFGKNYQKITEAIASLIDDYGLVRFIPLNIDDEESVQDLLFQIDSILQYGEDGDVRTRDFEEPDDT